MFKKLNIVNESEWLDMHQTKITDEAGEPVRNIRSITIDADAHQSRLRVVADVDVAFEYYGLVETKLFVRKADGTSEPADDWLILKLLQPLNDQVHAALTSGPIMPTTFRLERHQHYDRVTVSFDVPRKDSDI